MPSSTSSNDLLFSATMWIVLPLQNHYLVVSVSPLELYIFTDAAHVGGKVKEGGGEKPEKKEGIVCGTI